MYADNPGIDSTVLNNLHFELPAQSSLEMIGQYEWRLPNPYNASIASHGDLRITLPATFHGTLPLPFVLHTVFGDAWVTINGQQYRTTSPAFASYVNARSSFIPSIRIDSIKSVDLKILMLINPRLVNVQKQNKFELSGSNLLGLSFSTVPVQLDTQIFYGKVNVSWPDQWSDSLSWSIHDRSQWKNHDTIFVPTSRNLSLYGISDTSPLLVHVTFADPVDIDIPIDTLMLTATNSLASLVVQNRYPPTTGLKVTAHDNVNFLPAQFRTNNGMWRSTDSVLFGVPTGLTKIEVARLYGYKLPNIQFREMSDTNEVTQLSTAFESVQYSLSDTVAYEDSTFHAYSSLLGFTPSRYYILSAPPWIHLDSVTGSITGVPLAGNVGVTSITLRASDISGNYVDQLFSITVFHTNHLPIVAALRDTLAKEDSTFSSQILASDVDSPLFGDILHYQFLSKPSWLTGDSLTGMIAGLPRGKNVGDTSIMVRVNDGKGGADTAKFNLTVRHSNHSPVFHSRPDTTVIEDAIYAYNARATDQDTLLFGDIIRYRLLGPKNWLTMDSITGLVSGIPRTANLLDTIVIVQAYDNAGGTANQAYTLHITHVNHPPEIASTAPVVAAEDTMYTYQVKAVDPDTLIGDVLTYSLTRQPSWLSVNAFGAITGIPRGINVGDTLVTVRVNDGKGGSATQTFSITVKHTNHTPVFSTLSLPRATEDSYYSSRIWATDQDSLLFGDVVKYRLVLPSAHWLTLDSSTGILSGTPVITNLQDTIVTVEANDGKGGATQKTFSVGITHVNHPPEIVSIAPAAVAEDSLYRYALYAQDVDTLVGDILTYSLTRHPIWLTINSSTGLISGTPRGKNVGDTLATVRVSDGKGGSATQTFPITVSHTNHAPVIATDSLPAGTEDTFYQSRIYASDSDSALFGDFVRYRWTVHPFWLSLDSVTGTLAGTPHWRSAADTTLHIIAADNHGAVSEKQLLLNINHVNHAPVFVTSALPAAAEDSLFSALITASDQDTVFGDYVRFSISGAPQWLSIDSINGTLHGTPHAANVGDISVTLRIHDTQGASAVQSFSLSVHHTNHLPTLTTSALPNAKEDSVYHYQLAARFRGIPGNPPSLRSSRLPRDITHAFLGLGLAGSFKTK